jgi:hypothetical protein
MGFIMPEKSTVFHGIYGFLLGEIGFLQGCRPFPTFGWERKDRNADKKGLRFSTIGL